MVRQLIHVPAGARSTNAWLVGFGGESERTYEAVSGYLRNRGLLDSRSDAAALAMAGPATKNLVLVDNAGWIVGDGKFRAVAEPGLLPADEAIARYGINIANFRSASWFRIDMQVGHHPNLNGVFMDMPRVRDAVAALTSIAHARGVVYETIAIDSHGVPGGVLCGEDFVCEDNAHEFAGLFATLGSVMSPGGTLVLSACLVMKQSPRLATLLAAFLGGRRRCVAMDAIQHIGNQQAEGEVSACGPEACAPAAYPEFARFFD